MGTVNLRTDVLPSTSNSPDLGWTYDPECSAEIALEIKCNEV